MKLAAVTLICMLAVASAFEAAPFLSHDSPHGIPAGTAVAQTYTLTLQGYDYDGNGEESITLNGGAVASLPATDSPQNAAAWADFALNISSAMVVTISQGKNALVFSHAQWDCFVVDWTRHVVLTDPNGVVVLNQTARQPLSCTQTITYIFSVADHNPIASNGAVGFTVAAVHPVDYVPQNATFSIQRGEFSAVFHATLYNASWTNFQIYWALNVTAFPGSPVQTVNATMLQWTVTLLNRTAAPLGSFTKTAAGPVWGMGPVNMTLGSPEAILFSMAFVPDGIPLGKYVLLVWAQQSGPPVVPSFPNGMAIA